MHARTTGCYNENGELVQSWTVLGIILILSRHVLPGQVLLLLTGAALQGGIVCIFVGNVVAVVVVIVVYIRSSVHDEARL